MYIKDFNDCEEFISGDGAILREYLHPAKADLKIQYSLAHAIVKGRHKTKWHVLKTSEVYCILEGKGIMYIDDEKQEVKEGQVVYIPPNAKQCIENEGDKELKFICIVDPAWRPEDEELCK